MKRKIEYSVRLIRFMIFLFLEKNTVGKIGSCFDQNFSIYLFRLNEKTFFLFTDR